MTPREFSIEVIQKLTQAGHLAYWAGGCVRDLLLGKEPNDFDVATDADPQRVREIFGKKKSIPVGESFGVIIVIGPKSAGQVEVATFRTEGEYLDGRRPDSVEFCTPEEDAHRRDFTVNGMFYDPIGERVHDYVGGEEDLKRKVIRAIGTPQHRMEEDKLRLLRAVRFTASLGFELDSETADAVRTMAHQLIVVSAERIAQELRKMLVHENRKLAMALCEELDLFSVIFPEVTQHTIDESLERWQQILSLLDSLPDATFEIAMAALLRDVPIGEVSRKKRTESGTVYRASRRLKLSNQESETIEWLVQNRDVFTNFPGASLAKKKRLADSKHFESLLQLERCAAAIEQKDISVFAQVDQFLAETPIEAFNPPELIDGKELIKLGFKPGPKFKNLLNAVRTAQLNEEISSREDAIALVHTLSDNPSDTESST